MKDFSVRNFTAFSGPSLYIDKPSMVFKLYVNLKDKPVNKYIPAITEKFPELSNYSPNNVVDLFCFVLRRIISRIEMIDEPASKIIRDEEEWIIAVENIFDTISKQATYIVSDWFKSITSAGMLYNMDEGLAKLDQLFFEAVNKLPIDYELLLEARKRQIDLHILEDEGSILWGYGKNQVRNSGMKFAEDAVTDFEMIYSSIKLHKFLKRTGIPTPESAVCHYENDLAKEVKRLGFPLVVKPVNRQNEKWVIPDIDNIKTLRKEFNRILETAQKKDTGFDGILLQQQLPGKNYRILLINGKFISGFHIKNHHDNEEVQDITKLVHSSLISLFEKIASFFKIKVIEIDVVASDISEMEDAGSLGIIDIIPGPDLKYHLLSSRNSDVTNPGILIEKLLKPEGFELRIPIINGNIISDHLISRIYDELKTLRPNINFGSLSGKGIFINGTYFTETGSHESNCELLLRNPRLDIALINHEHEDILEFGTWHKGSDIVILNQARHTEYVMMRDLVPGGVLVEIRNHLSDDRKIEMEMIVSVDMKELYSVKLQEGDDVDILVIEVIKPYLESFVNRYERSE